MGKILLKDLAFARSGDKGDVCNIGVIAKSGNIYEFLLEAITPEKIKRHFKGMVKGGVEIYSMPNIETLEIVLRQSLDGGATRTLRFDQTGKSMCSALQRMELEADEALIDEAKRVGEEILMKYRL